MAEWKRVRLGDVACIKTGKLNSCAATIDGRYPFFTCAEFPLKIDTYAYDSESVLVAGNCTPYVNYYKGKFNAYQRTYIITPSVTYVSAKWLYYLMKRNIRQMIHQQQGTVEKYFVLSDFTDEELLLPPLPTQRKIAAVLGAIDDKIETNRKICANLEAQAQALFKSWFVDFEPFGGKMPKGWKIGKLGDVISRIGTGLNPRKNFKLGNGSNYYVTIKNMGQNRVYLDDKCDKVDDDAIKRINERSDLKKGDVLFSGIGTIGRTYLIDETPTNWNTSESVFNMRPREGIPSVYLYLLLLSDAVQDYVQINALGSAQKGIRMADLKVCPCVVPSDYDLDMFSQTVSSTVSKVQNYWRQSDSLAAMRDALLPKLMSGEIDVSKVEVA